MYVIDNSQMLLQSTSPIPIVLIRKFSRAMETELMQGCTFKGSIQTAFKQYSDMTLEEFEQVYAKEPLVSWNICYTQGKQQAFINFHHYLHSTNKGEAVSQLEDAQNHLFRQHVLRILDVEIR